MKIRALIFDVYGTLLEVGPPPADAQLRWELIWEDRLKTTPRLSLERFSTECQRMIDKEHADARTRGVLYPEIYWPEVVSAALPEFAHLSEPERSEFRFYHAQMAHTVRPMPGLGDALRTLRAKPVRLGLASNSQPYTLRELNTALDGAGLSREVFTASLCFFSFEHGFSKPDPHVFQILTARLRLLGVAPQETLMVGNRLDNDIEPARAHGWRTWHFRPACAHGSDEGGDLGQLLSRWF